MKKTILIIITVFIQLPLISQTLTPTVIGFGGSDFEMGNQTIEWTIGEAVPETLFSGRHFLTQGFQQPLNCSPPSIIAKQDTSICPGSTVKLSASGAANFEWRPVESISAIIGSSIFATPLVTTTYTVRGYNAENCYSENQVTVEVTPVMQLNLTATNSGGANGTIQSGIAGGTPPFNFLWSTGDTTGHLTGIPPGWYSLLVTDAEGCAVIDSAEVEGPLPCDIPANVTKQHSPHQITFSWAPQANAVTTQIQVKVKPGQASIAPDFRTAFALQGQTSKTIQVQPSNCGSFYMSRLRHICDSFSVAISDWKTIQVIPTSCLKQPGHIKATLFPNPANDVLNISWPSLKVETVTFTVLDIAGKKIISKKEKVVDGSNLINFSTSGLAEGIYLLKGNNKMIGRFAVVHN